MEGNERKLEEEQEMEEVDESKARLMRTFIFLYFYTRFLYKKFKINFFHLARMKTIGFFKLFLFCCNIFIVVVF